MIEMMEQLVVMEAVNCHHFLMIVADSVMPMYINKHLKEPDKAFDRISIENEEKLREIYVQFELTSVADSGNCVKSANGEFPVSS